jgi:rhodanese-related sulfurtransferase
MLWIGVAIVVIGVAVFALINVRKAMAARELRDNSVESEELKARLSAGPKVLLYDVRQPLDLLAHSEMIPGAIRLTPKQLLADPTLIPRDEDVVLYCTCDGQKTSLEIVRHSRSEGYTRLKVLRDGLAGWKAKGYPVEVYRESFRLDTAV